MAPDTSELYFASLAKHSNAVGFASVGDELLRYDFFLQNLYVRTAPKDDN